MATHSFSNLMRRLSAAGFKREIVRPALLPDWWNDSLSDDGALLPEVEIRVARFLNRPLAEVRDPSVSLIVPLRPGTVLRRTRQVDLERLGPAIHTALEVASAVVRSLRSDAPFQSPPIDAAQWRASIDRQTSALLLEPLLRDLWGRGVPVIPIDLLPAPSFQGLACIIEGRPVIVLGHQHDEPGRAAFVIGHEAGHIAAGDCTPGHPVVDEDEEVDDGTDIERRADLYAMRLLVGTDTIPTLSATDFRDLAKKAVAMERRIGADATTIILSWARSSQDYQTASMAIRALYRATGARALLKNYLRQNIDFEAASESDRSLIRLVMDDTAIAAAAD